MTHLKVRVWGMVSGLKRSWFHWLTWRGWSLTFGPRDCGWLVILSGPAGAAFHGDKFMTLGPDVARLRMPSGQGDRWNAIVLAGTFPPERASSARFWNRRPPRRWLPCQCRRPCLWRHRRRSLPVSTPVTASALYGGDHHSIFPGDYPFSMLLVLLCSPVSRRHAKSSSVPGALSPAAWSCLLESC